MKFFDRKPASPSPSPALARTADAANMPVFPRPAVSTEQMAFSLHQCTAAELNVTTRSMKAAAAPEARFDVLLQARQTPLEAEWTLSPEQARELAARLLSAAASCESADQSSQSPHWD